MPEQTYSSILLLNIRHMNHLSMVSEIDANRFLDNNMRL